MAARKKSTAKRDRARTPAKRAARARKRIAPAREARGLAAGEIALALDAPEVAPLADAVRAAGGAPLAAYHEPLSGKPIVLASLPRDAVDPTPFQRDLSPTHAKRLAQKIEESGSFLDPIIVVRGAQGGFWSPNGRHRLAAAKVLGMRQITALVSPDEDLAFRILALNTEKAHNVRDRSLEVIRMARALAERDPKAKETDYAAQLESAELLTLGVVFERESRFAAGAYAPFLRKVDRFSSKPLPASLREREGWASRLVAIDAEVRRAVAELEQRGFRSPYLRTFVVARCNPVRFHKAKKGDTAPPMPITEALTRMLAAAKKFDAAKVRQQDLALVAAVASDAD
ncbi:MAG: chromosome partitioning protein ParB [Proteobacteria bacterium]|nr:MAG: chromosome partitioning protein ParB [Pseudomonadota bacterium]